MEQLTQRVEGKSIAYVRGASVVHERTHQDSRLQTPAEAVSVL